MSAIWNSPRLRPTWIPSGTSSCSAASPASGHSDYKAMKPYIDIVDSIKASEMTKLDMLVSGSFNK